MRKRTSSGKARYSHLFARCFTDSRSGQNAGTESTGAENMSRGAPEATAGPSLFLTADARIGSNAVFREGKRVTVSFYGTSKPGKRRIPVILKSANFCSNSRKRSSSILFLSASCPPIYIRPVVRRTRLPIDWRTWRRPAVSIFLLKLRTAI